ncbi:MalM family protein [Photobacterium kagoshimensis]|uniref:MalM family protein n=1 Tax=Photobacterium kagoshimensis TaxID=2910242 RepID=UPI003D110DE6
MKKTFPMLLLATLLSGCVTSQDVVTTAAPNQVEKNLQSIDQITWTPIQLPSTTKFTIDGTSQHLNNPLSKSGIAAFTVPANRGAITIELKSYANKTIYSPTIQIYNSKNQLVQEYTSAQFKYEPAAMLEDDRLVGKFTFLPPLTEKEARILVFSTPEDIVKSTTVLHPAKAYAIARSTQPPEIADPIVQHSGSKGQFSLMLSSPSMANNQIVSNGPAGDHAPTIKETKGYYLNSIENAVNNGDLNKAMKLLDEAERLGIADARPTFINAVEAKK